MWVYHQLRDGHCTLRAPGPGTIGTEGGGHPPKEGSGARCVWPGLQSPQPAPGGALTLAVSFCSLERQPCTWRLAMATPMWFSCCAASAPIPISRTRWVMAAGVLPPFCSLHGCTDRRRQGPGLPVLSKFLLRFQRAGPPTEALPHIRLFNPLEHPRNCYCCCYHSHFTEEETEAGRGSVSCRSSHYS